MTFAWVALFLAGLTEIVMAIALKQAAGWTRVGPSLVGIAAALGSIFLLTHAVKTLPMATAYAVWTGIGTFGVALVGIALFGESASMARLTCMAAIAAGIVGLHLLEV
jgi:quaternary ammonium compound-resistance protein SugE